MEELRDWQRWQERDLWARVLAEAEAEDHEDHAVVARKKLDELADVSALDALRSNDAAAQRLIGQQWQAVQVAREQGASWAQIGEVLGMSRQAAWERFKDAIERQERYVGDLHDTDRAQAALGVVES